MCIYIVSIQFKFNMNIDHKGANYAMANQAASYIATCIYTDIKVASWLIMLN